jgi:hypothetical protein
VTKKSRLVSNEVNRELLQLLEDVPVTKKSRLVSNEGPHFPGLNPRKPERTRPLSDFLGLPSSNKPSYSHKKQKGESNKLG